MRTLDPPTVARAALKALDDGTLCAPLDKGPWYQDPNDPDSPVTCAIGAGLTPEERFEAQQSVKYEIAYLITDAKLFSVADPAHLDQLTQLQTLHDKATDVDNTEAFHAFLDYARELAG